jgi:PIN domain nuclease of toxin-antitoxin system
LSAYLDTQVAVWLAQVKFQRLSSGAREQIKKTDLLVSPMVLLELEYLYEIQRISLHAQEVQLKLQSELGVRTCTLDFASVVGIGIHENWTRDPFDRLIVANAKASGFSPLISADRKIRENYPRAVW